MSYSLGYLVGTLLGAVIILFIFVVLPIIGVVYLFKRLKLKKKELELQEKNPTSNR
jgi:uncharacterized metal-binding protein